MAPGLTSKIVAPLLLGATLAAPVSALDLFGKSCLEKLSERTRSWTECTVKFDRNDARCKEPAAKMHASMQACARKGESKAEIDAAMTEGYRLAGHRKLRAKPQDDAPATRPGKLESATLDKITPALKQSSATGPDDAAD